MAGKDSRCMTVGLDASPALPFHTGHPGEGFEVDLLGAIAARLGFSVRYESALWTKILAQLRERKLDMVCTAATITEERRKIVDFSRPYFEFELAIVTAGNNAIRGLRDLDGRALGVRTATTAEQFLRSNVRAKSIRVFDMNVDAYHALLAGELDAVLDDEPIAKAFEKRLPGLKVIATIAGTKMQYGMVFAKGNDGLRLAVDDALSQLDRDGTYTRLYRKWFGEQGSGQLPK